jgi:hypothetical protein
VLGSKGIKRVESRNDSGGRTNTSWKRCVVSGAMGVTPENKSEEGKNVRQMLYLRRAALVKFMVCSLGRSIPAKKQVFG